MTIVNINPIRLLYRDDFIPGWHLVIDSTIDVAHLMVVVSNIGVLSGMFNLSISHANKTILWENYIPDSKVYGANMGPTWVPSAPDGPHVGPMNFAIRDAIVNGTLSMLQQHL